jgi:hypothetical protein
MKIHKIISDEKPEYCLYCPIFQQQKCGKMKRLDVGHGWFEHAQVPDERCLIELKGGGN